MHIQVSHRETQAGGGDRRGKQALKSSEMGRPGTEMYSGILRTT